MGEQDKGGEVSDPQQDVAGEDDTRRKFREALDRKQQRQHATADGAAKDGSEKSHGAQGPTKGRTFRRKSG